MTDPINVGMYGLGQQQPSALQTLGQMQQVNLQGLQLQQAQQQMAAKQAMGPILQAAVNPQTGELDYNKAFIGLAGNPATAYLAGDFLAQGIQRKQTQADTALKELDLRIKQQGQVMDAVKGLAVKGNSVTQEDAINALTDRLNSGTIDRKQYQAGLDTIKRFPSGAPLAGFVKQTMLGLMASNDAMNSVNGTIKQIDMGDRIVLMQEHPALNTVRPLASIPKHLTPEQQVQQTPGPTGPQGQPTSMSMADRARQQGLGALVGDNPIPQTFGGGDPSGGAPIGTPAGSMAPTMPGAGAPDQAGAGGGPQTPSLPQPGQGAGASVPPPAPRAVPVGMSKMQEHLQADNAKYVDDTTKSVEKIGDAMQTLNHMEGLLEKFKAGPGASVRQEGAQFLQSIGAKKADVDKLVGGPEGLAAMQVFQNLALKYATQQLKAAIEGSRITNMEFKAVVDTKPNVNMRPEAIKAVIAQARMAYKLAQTQSELMQQWVASGKDLTEFRTTVMPRFLNAANKQLKEYYAQPGQL